MPDKARLAVYIMLSFAGGLMLSVVVVNQQQLSRLRRSLAKTNELQSESESLHDALNRCEEMNKASSSRQKRLAAKADRTLKEEMRGRRLAVNQLNERSAKIERYEKLFGPLPPEIAGNMASAFQGDFYKLYLSCGILPGSGHDYFVDRDGLGFREIDIYLDKLRLNPLSVTEIGWQRRPYVERNFTHAEGLQCIDELRKFARQYPQNPVIDGKPTTIESLYKDAETQYYKDRN